MAIEVPAIKVQQWLKEWETPFPRAGKMPPKHFFVFSMKAGMLRRLSDTHRRGGDRPEGSTHRIEPDAIQRRHDPRRSREIADFVRHGYPWSTLPPAKQNSGQYDDLIKPGWLPTAILVNIMEPGDKRRGRRSVSKADVVQVREHGNSASLVMPEGIERIDWEPKGDLRPLEIIDGQHRLWAFDNVPGAENYELPVVAFHGLERVWQAYLFWVINIKPKRISASLAFDLYPLLRAEEWLEKAGDLKVYRETRAQEMVEALWSHPSSPWHKRINMLGETGGKTRMVTQAAWIRALTGTFLRPPGSKGGRLPGLFTGEVEGGHPLPWNRAQEAAFLLAASTALRSEVLKAKHGWAKEVIRELPDAAEASEAPFYGRSSLLSHDQGIHGFLMVLNDLTFRAAGDLGLPSWQMDEEDSTAADVQTVSRALESLSSTELPSYFAEIADSLAKFDWRASSAESLDDDERERKSALRGTGGYGLLYSQLVENLQTRKGIVGKAASLLHRVD
jgi:DGQHR domain-containing protein